jgi:hypothetical protein
MSNGRVVRQSACPYCKKISHSDVSCECNCPHSLDPEVPICSVCITEAIDASKKEKVAAYELRVNIMTKANHERQEERLNRRKSGIQQDWKEPSLSTLSHNDEI